MRIGKFDISKNKRTFFIADIAANHDGKLSRAVELIKKAAEAGADAAKFQNFKAKTIVSDFGFKAIGSKQSHQSEWGESVYDTYDKAAIALRRAVVAVADRHLHRGLASLDAGSFVRRTWDVSHTSNICAENAVNARNRVHVD